MDNLYKCKIKGKIYRLIFELNRSNKIQIKTGVGLTDWFNTGGNVTQGSVSGAIISSNNFAVPMNSMFKENDCYH